MVHTHRNRMLSAIIALFSCLFFAQPAVVYADPTCGLEQIGGTVFIDENMDGVRDPSEPDIDETAAIQVFAYGAADSVTPVASAIIGQASGSGDYLLNLPAGSSGIFRIEFELPAVLTTIATARFATGGSGTTLAFVSAGDCNLDLGIQVIRPGLIGSQSVSPYTACTAANSQMAVSCFVLEQGRYTTGPTDTVVTIGYDNGVAHPADVSFPEDTTYPYDVASLTAYDAGIHLTEAEAATVGSVYGLAFHRRSNAYFASSYLKRHSAFGTGGIGAIYLIDRTYAPGDPNRVQVFATIPNAGTDPHPPLYDLSGDPYNGRNDWRRDSGAFPLVGKIGLGDMDMDLPEENLWVTNLNEQNLYRVQIGSGAPVAGGISSFPTNGSLADRATMVGQPCAGRPLSEIRPFAVKVHLNQVYVGLVCTAETSSSSTTDFITGRTLMRFVVYRYDPTTAGTLTDFVPVLSVPVRDSSAYPNNSPGFDIRRTQPWRRWNAVFDNDLCDRDPSAANGFDAGFCSNIQPILADIEFDDDNHMILGFRDRWGDMTGYRSFNPLDATNTHTYSGIAFGDILRACIDPAADPLNPVFGDYALEDNASCGGITTAGTNTTDTNSNSIGPNGGAYYFEDYWFSLPDHNIANIGFGGLAALPNSGEVAMTVQDPIPSDPDGANSGTSDAGLIWLSNDTGRRTRTYRLLDTNPPGFSEDEIIRTFGKANGLGDIEFVCVPNLEIGNRIWNDLDGNGIQDPDEAPIAGVTVYIFEDVNGDGIAQPDELRGTTITDADGQFLFNEGNVQDAGVYDGLKPYRNYLLVVNNPADFGAGSPLEDFIPTTPDVIAGTPRDDLRDSDASNQPWLGNPAFAAISVTTGGLGENTHSLDFGFTQLLATPTPTDTPTETPTDTPTNTPTETPTNTPTGTATQTLTPAPTSSPTSSGFTNTPAPVEATGTAAAGATQTVLAVTAALLLPTETPTPGVIVTIVVDPPFAQPGDAVTWTITITNTGTTDVPDYSFRTRLDDRLEVVDTTTSAGTLAVSGGTASFNIGTLRGGQQVVMTIRTRIRPQTSVPFVIDTRVVDAKASVVSASALPATGESDRNWLLWLALVGTAGLLLWIRAGLRRGSSR